MKRLLDNNCLPISEMIYCDLFKTTIKIQNLESRFKYLGFKLSEDFFAGNSKKEGQATYIAPLQPPTLASFRTWGSSAGAGRVRLALNLQK